MADLENKLRGSQPTVPGICSLMEATCKTDGQAGCGGGSDRNDAAFACLASIAEDGNGADLGSSFKTSIVSQAQLFGGTYYYSQTPGGTGGASYGYQAGGVGMGFAREASDVFTEGEGIAGHPAKWGYRPIRPAQRIAQCAKLFPAATPAADVATKNKNLAIGGGAVLAILAVVAYGWAHL